jgi:hypothetical protein
MCSTVDSGWWCSSQQVPYVAGINVHKGRKKWNNIAAVVHDDCGTRFTFLAPLWPSALVLLAELTFIPSPFMGDILGDIMGDDWYGPRGRQVGDEVTFFNQERNRGYLTCPLSTARMSGALVIPQVSFRCYLLLWGTFNAAGFGFQNSNGFVYSSIG